MYKGKSFTSSSNDVVAGGGEAERLGSTMGTTMKKSIDVPSFPVNETVMRPLKSFVWNTAWPSKWRFSEWPIHCQIGRAHV